PEHYGSLCTEGAAILRAQDQTVQQIVGHARKSYIEHPHGGDNDWVFVTGLAVNSPVHQSEVGHELANQSGTFGLAWYLAEDNTVRCSFRSNGDYDVSAIARVFGGGGHRNAAGCEVSIETLLDWLK
ncbi:MAG TPA: DHHA1 domain-containing protein, partial [Nitrospira sp.]|nr:DHHA1 domain-containing protein [Nitrospira sp.]